MLMIVLIFICLYFVWTDFPSENGYHSDYMGKDQTAAINGLFALLIIVSHFVTYASMENWFDTKYIELKKYLGQLVVTTFLFYSGYGIHRSIISKGRSYIKWIPWRRFFRVLLHFDAAIILYIFVGTTILDKTFDRTKIFYSLFGWESVGNSNWYIFAVLCAYVITYAAFMIFGEKGYGGVLAVTALSLCYVLFMAEEKDTWWYDTFFCYVAGMWYSIFKEKTDRALNERKWIYWIALSVCICTFIITHDMRSENNAYYQIHCIFFVLIIVLLSMKLKCTNKLLMWIGKYAFWIYILQRIPMQILRRYPQIKNSTYVFFVLCLGITILLAYGFGKLFDLIDRKLFSEKKKAES